MSYLNRSFGLLGGLLFVASTVVACGGADAAAGGTGAGEDDSVGSCTCTISVNGQGRTIACGSDACIAGAPYSCGMNATIREGGSACAVGPSASSVTPPAAAAPNGNSSSSAAASTSGKSTAAAPGTKVPCNQSNDVRECDATKEFCIKSQDAKGNNLGGEICAPLPADCHGCDCVDVEAAWKVHSQTNNCTAVVIACTNSSGAITAACKKNGI